MEDVGEEGGGEGTVGLRTETGGFGGGIGGWGGEGRFRHCWGWLLVGLGLYWCCIVFVVCYNVIMTSNVV